MEGFLSFFFKENCEVTEVGRQEDNMTRLEVHI